MTIPPNLSTLSRDQVQTLINVAANEQMPACNGDIIAADRQARLLYPQLWDRLKTLMTPAMVAVTPVLSNAQLAAIPQASQDTQGLYAAASQDEFDAVWQACGNSCNPAKADVGFNALIDDITRNRRLDRPTAESEVRTRFKALAALSDSIISARKLGVAIPASADPNNPIWIKVSQGVADWQKPSLAGMGPPPPPLSLANPFPMPGVRPLTSALGNDMGQKAVRATYADAIKKHLRDNPQDDPIEAHKAVLRAHPALARALKVKPSDADAAGHGDDGDDTDETSGALANSATTLGNSADLPTELIDTTKPFLMRTVCAQWQ